MQGILGQKAGQDGRAVGPSYHSDKARRNVFIQLKRRSESLAQLIFGWQFVAKLAATRVGRQVFGKSIMSYLN